MVITVVGRSDNFVSAVDLGATEMEKNRFRNIQMAKRSIKLTRVYNAAVLPALAAKGLVITAAKNQTDNPINDFGQLRAGDSITLFGPAKVIEHFIPSLGYDCSQGQPANPWSWWWGFVCWPILWVVAGPASPERKHSCISSVAP